MWRRLENGEYTHILLGPEQATHHRFLRILRSARFNQGLAFIAVDELHMVFQWRDFRVAYPDIHRLRALVPYDTPWFGCTATLNKEAEEFVVRKAGFRRTGNFTGGLQLIRTSVDRPDISIIVQPLEKGATRSDYRRLEFLFHGLRKDEPQSIDKTIVYIDSKAQLIAARNHLVKYIRNLGYSNHQGNLMIRWYDADTSGGEDCGAEGRVECRTGVESMIALIKWRDLGRDWRNRICSNGNFTLDRSMLSATYFDGISLRRLELVEIRKMTERDFEPDYLRPFSRVWCGVVWGVCDWSGWTVAGGYMEAPHPATPHPRKNGLRQPEIRYL